MSIGKITQAYVAFVVTNVRPILRYIWGAESKNGIHFVRLALVWGVWNSPFIC